jgi:hypothetical protein
LLGPVGLAHRQHFQFLFEQGLFPDVKPDMQRFLYQWSFLGLRHRDGKFHLPVSVLYQEAGDPVCAFFNLLCFTHIGSVSGSGEPFSQHQFRVIACHEGGQRIEFRGSIRYAARQGLQDKPDFIV